MALRGILISMVVINGKSLWCGRSGGRKLDEEYGLQVNRSVRPAMPTHEVRASGNLIVSAKSLRAAVCADGALLGSVGAFDVRGHGLGMVALLLGQLRFGEISLSFERLMHLRLKHWEFVFS